MTAHVHLESMRLYCEDAAETETPWKRWERRPRVSVYAELPWAKCDRALDWHVDYEYRRIPHTIGGIEVPAPEREALAKNAEYWAIDTTAVSGALKRAWSGSWVDRQNLKRGLVYRRKEDAQACADALIKLLTGGRDD